MSLIQEVLLAKQQAQRKHEINKEIELEKDLAEQEHDSKQLELLLDGVFETHKNAIIDRAKKGENSYYFTIPVSDNYFKNPTYVENEIKAYCLSLGFKNVEVQYSAFAKNPDLLILSRIAFVISSLFWITLFCVLYIRTEHLFYLVLGIMTVLVVVFIAYFYFFPTLDISVHF